MLLFYDMSTQSDVGINRADIVKLRVHRDNVTKLFYKDGCGGLDYCLVKGDIYKIRNQINAPGTQ